MKLLADECCDSGLVSFLRKEGHDVLYITEYKPGALDLEVVERAKSKSGGIMKTFEYTAIVWKEEKGYVSKCPELGVASCGDTFEEAVKNLKEAVELYIENARELVNYMN